jgi:hypothetical protein
MPKHFLSRVESKPNEIRIQEVLEFFKAAGADLIGFLEKGHKGPHAFGIKTTDVNEQNKGDRPLMPIASEEAKKYIWESLQNGVRYPNSSI